MLRAATLLAAVALAAPALAQAPAPASQSATPATAAAAPAAAGPKFTVEKSTIGEILDNPEAKAAFTAALPSIAANEQLSQALGMTLTEVAGYAPDQITPEVLAKLNVEFAKIK